MDEPFLQLAGVTKRFGARTVVDRVSLEVAAGEVVAFLGPSGCGKTTLLRLVAGLDTPDDGEVSIAGRTVAAAGRTLVPPHARRTGFVFQDLALWPHLTVAGNLDFVLESAGVPRRARRGRIEEVLRLVRLERFAESSPSQLSGGEQQRVAIARALVARPELLLLDEPLASLDTDLKVSMLGELAALQREFQVTTLYVSHDPAEAAFFARRVVHIKAGRVERVEPAESLRRRSTGGTQ